MNFSCICVSLMVISTTMSSGVDPASKIDKISSPANSNPTEFPSEYKTCREEVKAAKAHPDQGKLTEDIIESYGYSLQIHTVTTKDGYILTLHRITGSKTSPPKQGKPSVYVHHGMGGSSVDWFFQHGRRNLAFLLADEGYDVWLANCRGTSYSLGHETLSWETNLAYWDFSWHEIAMYDIPATIDIISDVTGNQKIFYIGFSMGTTVYFVSMSEMPYLNGRIISAFMLAPVAYAENLNSPIRLIFDMMKTPEQYYLINSALQGRIGSPEKMEKLLGLSLQDFCVPTTLHCGLCSNVLFALLGFDAVQMNYTNLPKIIYKLPDIMSIKTLAHYAQSMRTGGFRKFDYGMLGNLIKYKGVSPPAYDLSKVIAETYFFHGDSDNLAVTQDVEITREKMKLAKENSFQLKLDYFNHLDFQIAKDADDLVYKKILRIMSKPRP